MPVKLFASELLNKIFIPVMATGTVATAGVVAAVTVPDDSTLTSSNGSGRRNNEGDDLEISLSLFDNSDYEEYSSGLNYGDITSEEIARIETETTSVSRCYNPALPGYFMEYGFNDNDSEWTYLINHGVTPYGEDASFMSLHSNFDDEGIIGFKYHAITFGYMDEDTLELKWQENGESWTRWKYNTIKNYSRNKGFSQCDGYEVIDGKAHLRSSNYS